MLAKLMYKVCVAASGTIVALLLVLASTGPANAGENFRAILSGDEEVPPVDNLAHGTATFKLSADGTELSYRLIVANVEFATQAHIHVAPAGTNGPVVAFLFGFVPEGETVNGVLAVGTITASDLRGPLAGMTMDDLVAELATGNAYVNVHTQAHPAGEIRGQVF